MSGLEKVLGRKKTGSSRNCLFFLVAGHFFGAEEELCQEQLPEHPEQLPQLPEHLQPPERRTLRTASRIPAITNKAINTVGRLKFAAIKSIIERTRSFLVFCLHYQLRDEASTAVR